MITKTIIDCPFSTPIKIDVGWSGFVPLVNNNLHTMEYKKDVPIVICRATTGNQVCNFKCKDDNTDFAKCKYYKKELLDEIDKI